MRRALLVPLLALVAACGGSTAATPATVAPTAAATTTSAPTTVAPTTTQPAYMAAVRSCLDELSPAFGGEIRTDTARLQRARQACAAAATATAHAEGYLTLSIMLDDLASTLGAVKIDIANGVYDDTERLRLDSRVLDLLTEAHRLGLLP